MVTAQVELIEVQGRKLRFRVSCRDELDLIWEGFHERYVIDGTKFTARLANKSARLDRPVASTGLAKGG